MEIEKEEQKKQFRFSLAGPLTVDDVNSAREYFVKYVKKKKQICLDLAGVDQCDTLGVQFLISMGKTAREGGLPLVLMNCSPAVEKAFMHVGLSLEDV